MKKLKLYLLVVSFILFASLAPLSAKAAGDLDQILDYQITVELQPDATAKIDYHIEWKVLDSSSEGPLSWVLVGIPNKHYISYSISKPCSIKDISYSTKSGQTYVRLDLDRNYYADEIAVMDFTVHADYIYQMNYLEEGYTTYEFTPGWFDDIEVLNCEIHWKIDTDANGESLIHEYSQAALVSNGYLNWQNRLGHGQKLTVMVTYPNDAFVFDESKLIDRGGSDYDDDDDDAVLGAFVIFVVIIVVIAIKIKSDSDKYNSGANLGSEYETKITRTKVEYYPNCQGCGGVREEGKDNCQYCGRSFIKSEEVLKEETIKKEDKSALNHVTEGVYHYTSAPNVYVRVHTTRVKKPVTRSTYHSSCAHSSCACACACACAGGGRAGCSTKDFYKTNLKLNLLKVKKGN